MTLQEQLRLGNTRLLADRILMCEAADRIVVLEAALEKVKEASAVCDDFELCKHASCNASYTQYAIAAKALESSP